MGCFNKILLSRAAVLAYFAVPALIGFHVGRQYFLTSSFLGPKLRARFHIQNASVVIIEEETVEVRLVDITSGDRVTRSAKSTTRKSANASQVDERDATSMEDDLFSFDVAV